MLDNSLLIIDGSCLLNVQFFGNLPFEIKKAKRGEDVTKYYSKILHTKDGRYTNGVFGFMKTLFSIIEEQKPKYLLITWDLTRDTFRREIYPDYKGTRGEVLTPLTDQFKLCQEVLKKMNIPQLMDSTYEADDYCGTICKMFKNEVPIYIMSKDHDWIQNVDDNVKLWMLYSASLADKMYAKYGLDKNSLEFPYKTFEFNKDLLKQEFGYDDPKYIVDVKAITGDTSDNIPGIKGLAEKSVIPLINKFHTVENLYNYLESKTVKELKTTVKQEFKDLGISRSPIQYLMKKPEDGVEFCENDLSTYSAKQCAMLSKRLATIKTDIDLKVSLEDLLLKIDETKKQEVFSDLEFKSLM